MSGDAATVEPRLRFAPSPTGELHLGNARTALVNWLEARRHGGTLVLRIEDTDRSRTVPGAEATILEDLRWLGIDWDEGPDRPGDRGPYRQSERTERYQAGVERLLQGGAAFRCFCSEEDLEVERRAARRRGETFRYPGTCRGLDPAEAAARAGETPSVVRFRVPDRAVRFIDGLRGETGVAKGLLGDFVICRTDGTATYNLAVVVDDGAMEIDHVIRGEDHLPNTPRQLLLYEALEIPPPRFTHLPLVLGPDRSRLSKRHGAASVSELRARGFLGGAVANYLALLGWEPPGGEEMLAPGDLVAAFDVAELNASSVVLDADKLEWLNGRHLAALGVGELLEIARDWVAALGTVDDDSRRAWWEELLDLVRPRCRRLDELDAAVEAILHPPLERVAADPALRAEVEGDAAVAALRAFAAAAADGRLRDPDGFRAVAREIGEQSGLSGRKLYHPLRVALTAADGGPELARLVPAIERAPELEITPRTEGVGGRIGRVLGLVGAEP